MDIKVFMIPFNSEYIKRLKCSLEKIDIPVKLLAPFHYSSFANIAKMIFFRFKGYKVIHIHWLYIFPSSFIMICFYYLCKILRIKIVYEMHNIVPHDFNENDLKNSKWFYEASDAIIFHSAVDIQRSKEILKTNSCKAHTIIPHGHLNEVYENKVTKKEARNILRLPENHRIILCFGNIRENRGYEYVIHATKDMVNTIVVIAGKTKNKHLLKRMLAYEKDFSHIRLFIKNWIPDEELQIFFNACDIVVLPYTEITTSGGIPTAYGFSRPVISTSIGGIKDQVNEDTGILVPPKNVNALEQAIEKMFNMNYEDMGRYAHEYASRTFSWESNALKAKTLYESVLNKK